MINIYKISFPLDNTDVSKDVNTPSTSHADIDFLVYPDPPQSNTSKDDDASVRTFWFLIKYSCIIYTYFISCTCTFRNLVHNAIFCITKTISNILYNYDWLKIIIYYLL
jgi:hypothetical protein